MKTIILLLALSTSAIAQTPIITTSSFPNGNVGVPYSFTLQATGGTPPYTWNWTACSGACNTGLGFDPPALSNTSTDGILGGTPTNAGTSTFTFVLTDSVGAQVSASFNITILPPVVYKFSCPGQITGTISVDSTGKATVNASSITLNRGCTATKQ